MYNTYILIRMWLETCLPPIKTQVFHYLIVFILYSIYFKYNIKYIIFKYIYIYNTLQRF